MSDLQGHWSHGSHLEVSIGSSLLPCWIDGFHMWEQLARVTLDVMCQELISGCFLRIETSWIATETWKSWKASQEKSAIWYYRGPGLGSVYVYVSCWMQQHCPNLRLLVPQVSGQWKQLLNKTINPPVYLIQSVHRSWQYLFMLTPTYHFQLHSLLIFSGEDGNEQLTNRKCDAGRRTQCIVGMSSQGMFYKLTYKTITTRYKFLQKPHVYRVHAHILMKHGASFDIRRRHVKFHLRGSESCLKKWTCVWRCVCLRMPRYVVKLMMLSPMKLGKNFDTITGNSVFHRVSHHLLSSRSE